MHKHEFYIIVCLTLIHLPVKVSEKADDGPIWAPDTHGVVWVELLISQVVATILEID